MKKALSAILVLAMVLALGAAASADDSTEEGLCTFDDGEISFSYPAEWELETVDGNSRRFNDGYGNAITFLKCSLPDPEYDIDSEYTELCTAPDTELEFMETDDCGYYLKTLACYSYEDEYFVKYIYAAYNDPYCYVFSTDELPSAYSSPYMELRYQLEDLVYSISFAHPSDDRSTFRTVPEAERDALIKVCEDVTIHELERNPGSYEYRKVRTEGTVTAIIREYDFEDSYEENRYMVSDRNGGNILVDVPVDKLSFRLLENDTVEVLGTETGTGTLSDYGYERLYPIVDAQCVNLTSDY